MLHRLITPIPKDSFFLFGARGTGKTSWLKEHFNLTDTWYIDLLDPETEDRFRQRPKLLESEFALKNPKPKWIVIDEVQRVPKLLNLVHRMIENQKIKFALTGSSARKLKRGGANLLAGRATVQYLFPFTQKELRKEFSLEETLHWGMLPKIYSLLDAQEKMNYLRAYALVYLNEEIRAEQIVRQIEPFRDFLEVSAQMNGKVLNYTKIARDVGAQVKSVMSYYQILEDTWMGFHVPAYHESIRKAQRLKPKFYWFDLGVKRSLERTLDMPVKPGTSYFGESFEHFFVAECFRLNHYLKKDFRLSYFMTHNSDAEIDLVLSRGRRPPILIEIKSASKIDEVEVRAFSKLRKSFPSSPAFYVSLDPNAALVEGIKCLPWNQALVEIFG
jgi:predicted AAA+ superfamily ATPase